VRPLPFKTACGFSLRRFQTMEIGACRSGNKPYTSGGLLGLMSFRRIVGWGETLRNEERMVTNALVRHFSGTALALTGVLGIAGPVLAQDATGQPMPWQLNLQPAATPVAEMVHRFNTGLLVVAALILLLVLVLLVYCVLRF